MGSSGSARRYSRNHCCFLFLRLLRCFSSPGSLPQLMDWATGGGGSLRRVSPFRHPRIVGYLLLPGAFRSLSRLSSALSAKASTICSFLHDQLAFGHGIWPSGYTCLAWHASVLVFSWLMFFTSYLGCLLLDISSFLSYAVFKVHAAAKECGVSPTAARRSQSDAFRSRTPFNCRMENTRFELVTSCLQGRRSPN